MRTKRLILPVLTSAIVIATGCQSGTQPKTAAAGAAPVGQTPAVSSPAPSVAAAPETSTAPASTVRIKAGAGAIKDSSGNAWLADTGFVGGDVIERPDLPIANSKEQDIYRSEHYAMDAFAYALPNGKYQVKLHFCETFEGITGPGERVFTFNIEGKTFKEFDVWAKSGGFARAYVETVPVEIADGKLDIKFTPGVENPQINGIEILPVQ